MNEDIGRLQMAASSAERTLGKQPQLAEMGRLPSFAANESSHSVAYSLNVGNLHDTGHLTGGTPPAAMAEVPTFAVA
jgi:hypothetical protein